MPTIESSVLDLCAQEPIHIIGFTQAYGFLIAVSEPDLIVHYISENVCALAGKTAAAMVGHRLQETVGVRQSRILRASLVAGRTALNQLRVLIGRPAQRFSCNAHRNGEMLVLEFEPYDGSHSLEPLDFLTDLQQPIERMESQVTVEGLGQVAARELRATDQVSPLF